LDRITDAFVWPVRDPDWFVKLIIIGLISLIPIVGAINGLGWMLASLDRLRSGEDKLAPANFSHIARGVQLFVVELVYAIAITIVALVLYLPGFALATHEGNGNGNAALIALAILLNLAAFALIAIGSLGYQFALPAIILATDKGGIGAGLKVRDVIRRSRANPIDTLIAGLMLLAASFVSGLGVFVCVVGIIFTVAYALAMQAWIVRSFEIGSNAAKAE
jgi:hypothetical protein